MRETIPHLLHSVAQRAPDAVTLYRPDGKGGFASMSAREQAERADAYAAALHAWEIRHGDRVAIISNTRYEWALLDRAILQLGGVTVGIYPTSTADQCAYILNHSEARVMIVEDRAQWERLAAQDLPLIEKVVLIEDEGPAGSQFSLTTMQEIGEAKLQDQPDLPEKLRDTVQPEDMAALVYTSGTTGPPKGVVLRHQNLYSISQIVTDYMNVTADDVGLSYLPLAHILQRVNNYIAGAAGLKGYYIEDMLKVMDECKRINPTTFSSVPRVYEKIHAGVMANVGQAPPRRRQIFQQAIAVGKEVTSYTERGAEPPFMLKLKRAVYERLVYKRLRTAIFGNRIKYLTSGAAPMPMELLQFFHAIGLPIYEGYGLTESSAPFTLNRAGSFRLGTVGPALPGSKMKIAEDGEILIKGPGVFGEYFKNPEATAEAIDSDGWFHTGDIGTIDGDGYLTITDRKKNLIVTAGGKNVAPANIELLLVDSPYINQVMVYGDRRRYLVAIMTLDEEAVMAWAARNAKADRSMRDLVRDEGLKQLIQAEVDQVNGQLASFETIKYFHIASEEFSVGNGMLTPTLKLMRRKVVDAYGDALEEMYDPTLTRA